MRRALFGAVFGLAGLALSASPAQASTIVGFDGGAGFAGNGAAVFSSNSVQLTSGALGQASSAFATAKQDVTRFAVAFDYTAAAGVGAADGVTFTIQNSAAGAAALGSAGGGLGYGGIANSVAFQINLFAASAGGRGVGINANGLTAQSAGGNAYQSTGALQLLGQAVHVELTYDGSTLTQTLSAGAQTFTTTTAIDILGLVGAADAFVGFTGATGFESSTQTVSNFTFETLTAALDIGGPALDSPVPTPLPLGVWAGLALGAMVVARRRA
ncbi:MAG: hypothetical protein ACAI43_04435 [Phycisphaerae bacterium]